MLSRKISAIAAAGVVLACGVGAQAIVMETVPVGNPGNAGELSGAGAGGYGPDRICGAVNYTYNIDKYEVTTSQYCAFLNAVAKTDTYGLYNTKMADTTTQYYWGCNIQRSGSSGNYTYIVGNGSPTDVANWANRPVNFVSWGDAARFSNWLHNGQPTGAQTASTTEDGSYYLNGATSTVDLLAVIRKANATWAIPTEDEWYKAAYHKNDGVTGNYWDYPTSSDTVPGRDTADVSGNNANYYGTLFPIDSPHYTTVAGQFQNSASPYGTFDQGGNVYEWNESVMQGSGRGVRGGSFYSTSVDLHASGRPGSYYSPTSEYSHTGFRVAEVPEPTALSLLALGGLSLTCRSRRIARG